MPHTSAILLNDNPGKMKGGHVPAPRYESSKRELIEAMRETAGQGDRQFDVAKAILEVKGQESMRWATWVLALATIGLIVVTAANFVAVLLK